MQDRARRLLAVAPATAFLFVLFVLPISLVLALSFDGEGPLGEHYLRIFTAPVYRRVLLTTLETGLVVTTVCLVLAYPFAYLLTLLPPRKVMLLMGLVALPWLTSLLVRSFAWMVLLGQAGIVNRALMGIGLIDQPLPLMYSAIGVYVGMVHILLPYMIITLYGVMSGIDRNLLRAGQASGATPWRAFLHIFVPLSLPGIAGGCLLVFIMAIGFYVTPALLGGRKQVMVAQLITSEMVESVNWEFGAALAAVLLMLTLAGLLVFNRFIGLSKFLGRA